MVDELQESPVLARVLGDALPRLERFHDKLSQEGEPRGLIGLVMWTLFGNVTFSIPQR